MTGLSLSPAGCGLRAFGVVRATPDAIAGLRLKPGPALAGPFRPNLLKHSDEQTVVSLAAVLTAVQRFGLQDEDFTAWGAVAAPRWMGRPRAAAALNKFHREGVSGASPMVVPHLSLHAVSGTLSQVLRLHGPNFGVGSGPGNVAEGLLAAVALFAEGHLPGLWLMLSQWDPEPAPDDLGRVASPAACCAAALALVPVTADFTGPRLRVLPPSPHVLTSLLPTVPVDVGSLADFLEGSATAASWSCPLDWGGRVELQLSVARCPLSVVRSSSSGQRTTDNGQRTTDNEQRTRS